MGILELTICALFGILVFLFCMSGSRPVQQSARANSKQTYSDELPDETAGQFLARMQKEEQKQETAAYKKWAKANPQEAARLKSLRDGSHWNHPSPKQHNGRVEIIGKNVDKKYVGAKATITDSFWAPGGGVGYVYHVTLDDGTRGSINHFDLKQI